MPKGLVTQPFYKPNTVAVLPSGNSVVSIPPTREVEPLNKFGRYLIKNLSPTPRLSYSLGDRENWAKSNATSSLPITTPARCVSDICTIEVWITSFR